SHGDAAPAIVREGQLLSAVQEERSHRMKHCAGFPAEAGRYGLQVAGVGIEDIAHIGVSREPSAHMHKKILFAAGRAAKQVAGGARTAAGGRRQEAASSPAIEGEVSVLPEVEAGETPAVPANGSAGIPACVGDSRTA